MISIIIIAVFFVGSAFFSGTEIGLISLDKYKLKKSASKDKKSKKLYNFVNNPDKVLGATLIGNNISNVIVSSVFTAYVVNEKILGETSAILILTGFLLIFAEMIPKIYFRKTAEKSIPKLFFIIRYITFIFSPFIWCFTKINNSLSTLFKTPQHARKNLFSKEDISYLVKEARRNGDVKKDEQELIKEVLNFRELIVKNIMVPRTNIVGIQKDAKVKDVIELSKNKGFTRIPVYSTDIDHIIGMMVIHDLLKTKNVDIKIDKYLREVYFVPEVMKVTTLLTKLQEKKTPLAVVVDEYGGTAGLVSVEDLIEELVGEIEDEYDMEVEDIHKLAENTFLINAEVEIEQLIESLI